MSTNILSTNYTGLVEPRMMRSALFPPVNPKAFFGGGTGASNENFGVLQGTIGAGSILIFSQLVPTGSNWGGSTGGGNNDIILAITGNDPTLTGDVAYFSGYNGAVPLRYFNSVVPQDSYFVVYQTGDNNFESPIPTALVLYTH